MKIKFKYIDIYVKTFYDNNSFSRDRDLQNSNRVGQFEHETAKIENQVGSNLHGYDVSGNAHMTSAFTVTKNNFFYYYWEFMEIRIFFNKNV